MALNGRKPMLKDNAPILLIAGLLLLSGCDRNAGAAEAAAIPPTPTINDSMTKIMSVHGQTIWDISSNAFNARGDGLMSSKVSAKDWTRISEAGRQLGERASMLAQARHITVSAPDETIMGADAASQKGAIGHAWDAASAEQIQGRIDANRALFTRRAQVLAQAGNDLVKASRTKDIKTLYRVSSGMDDVCDGCHKPFWGTDDPPPFPKRSGQH
jgi:hypothetical protein